MKRRLLLAGALSLLISLTSFSQDKNRTIVVIGSSTADGYKVSADSSFVGRLAAAFSKNKHDGTDTSVIVLAEPGYTTYKAMPDNFVMPPDRKHLTVDKNKNISKALSYNPDIVIINFPSNDQAPGNGYSVEETMSNLHLMNDSVIQTGAKCFITTSQPRDEYNLSGKAKLKQLADSVQKAFGVFALDLWDALVDSDYNRRSELRGPDLIHLNNLGHAVIFDIIMEKNIFAPLGALPVVLTGFTARLNNNEIDLKWEVDLEDPYTSYELQRSANGTLFVPVYHVTGHAGPGQKMTYYWFDRSPLPGTNYYRLRIVEPDGTRYSRIISARNSEGVTPFNKAYFSNNDLMIEMEGLSNQSVSITVFDQAGKVVQKGKYVPGDQDSKIRVPIGNAPRGVYIIRINAADGRSYTRRIMKGS